ncbi:MAG: DUF1295 domain-containing protein [Candidatus Aenigmarchaeota archaeon]|nr:DUF1295 domain-containing protein [Candidatus Aenigmarchaeota archaeon]
MFSRKNIYSTIEHYFYGSLLYGMGLFFYLNNSYYDSLLKDATKEILIFLYFSYLAVAPFAFFLNSKKDINDHKPTLIFKTIKKIVFGAIKYACGFMFVEKQKFPKMLPKEKTAILFVFVKLFYVPLMLNFLIGNYHGFFANYRDLVPLNSIETLSLAGYTFALSFIFFVDVLFFSFGYLFEAGFLKNKVRSVEPTLLGWAVALVCYPPFNTHFTKYVGWVANDYVMFSTINITFIARMSVIFLLMIYLWATILLGTKCSNLTNRGIVTTGAYKYIRHPAYISKNLAWWITIIPIMSVPVFITMFIWSFVYYLRAITEERHLSQDPDYRDYCKKTRYMFVPYVV